MNQKVKFLRQTLGFTEKEISSFLNISAYKYISFEKAELDIPCDILILLSKTYGIDVELMTDKKFTEKDLLHELEKQNIIEEKKEIKLKRLKNNLLQKNTNKITYHSIKKVKDDIQQNIISSIMLMIKKKDMKISDFAEYMELPEENISSILSKKRFPEIDELLKISEKSETPINVIINKSI